MSLKRYLFLLSKWTGRDFRSRYRRSQLRLLWAVLQPFLFVLVYVVIFGIIFEQSSGDRPYLSYLLSGVVIYRIVTSAMNATTCLVDNHSTMCHARFPHEIIPISRVLGNSADILVTVSGLLIVSAIQGVRFSATIILVPLVLVGTMIFAAAVSVILSTVQVFVRDLEFVMGFVGMALFFASPISYLPEQLPSWLSWLNWANPVSVYIEALRGAVFDNRVPGELFVAHVLGAIVLLGGSLWYTRSIGHRMVDLG